MAAPSAGGGGGKKERGKKRQQAEDRNIYCSSEEPQGKNEYVTVQCQKKIGGGGRTLLARKEKKITEIGLPPYHCEREKKEETSVAWRGETKECTPLNQRRYSRGETAIEKQGRGRRKKKKRSDHRQREKSKKKKEASLLVQSSGRGKKKKENTGRIRERRSKAGAAPPSLIEKKKGPPSPRTTGFSRKKSRFAGTGWRENRKAARSRLVKSEGEKNETYLHVRS